MKQIYATFFILIFIHSNLFSQLYSNYVLNFEDQFASEILFIDTLSNLNNIWQIGSPQKTNFTFAYSNPNVIITDIVNSYPPNDTSSFIISNISDRYGFDLHHTVILAGQYYVNSDTLTDYGKIEFSPDNGITWIDILNDSIAITEPYPYTWYWDDFSKPVLSGNSNEWKSFWINLADLGHDLGVRYGDTILYKFTFISDSIETNKDGLMFDNLHFEDWVEGIAEVGFELFQTYSYPNPAKNYLVINLGDKLNKINIDIFDIKGKSLINKQLKYNDVVDINIAELSSGIYFYKVVDFENKKFSVGKFIKE